MRPALLMAATGMAAIVSITSHAAEPLGYPARPLLTTGSDVLGQPIKYPEGKPQVTSAIITLDPGEEGELHRHEVPMYAYILQGEITVDYGPRGTRVFRRGDALIEAQYLGHKGMNKGTAPVAILVVYMGAEGMPNAVPLQ